MNRLLPHTITVVTALLVSTAADARTWRITPDGAGDAPSLEAAMDSATAGDTVLVAPGEYAIGSIDVTSGATLLSEGGPMQTKMVPAPGPDLTGIGCSHLNATTEISGFWIDGFTSGASVGIGAISVYGCDDVRILNNIFTNNSYAGVTIGYRSYVTLYNNTFVGNLMSVVFEGGYGRVRNNILWDEPFGLDGLPVACNDAADIEYIPLVLRPINFSADPMFCSPGDYHISAASPCAPGNVPVEGCDDLVGALPVGCTPSTVELHSWGSIKALYE